MKANGTYNFFIACMQAKIQTGNTKAGRKETNFTKEKTHNKFFQYLTTWN